MRLQSAIRSERISRITAADVDAAAVAIEPYNGGFSGRGITICTGGSLYFANAWVLIRMLRRHGCNLPVQFWHFGEEELDDTMRRLVAPYGVECVDARKLMRKVGRRISGGWPLKAFSILHSPFEEVLALDADNIPIRNPEYLFDYAAYQETGAIFWPDIGRTEPSRAIWPLMGVPFRSEPEFESGQIVVHKALTWEPLNLTMWMNEEGRADFFYKIIWGDKDTFRFAWHKFGFPFAMTQVPLQMLSVVGGPCCAGVMCQHDLDGERLFQHRNLLKWELFAENPWVPGFLFEGECREYLAQLRASWGGHIGNAVGRQEGNTARWRRELQDTVWLLETNANSKPGTLPSAATQDAPAEPLWKKDGQTTQRDRWPKPRQRDQREMRFLPEGNCGRSSTEKFTFWEVREERDEARLILAGRHGSSTPTAKLTRQADGSWVGRSCGSAEKAKLRLRAVESVYPSAAKNGAQVSNLSDKRHSSPQVGHTAGSLPADRTDRMPVLHVFNSAHGIGDHITGLYACVGAIKEGRQVVFHTPFPQWFTRVSHPGLTITGELPAGMDEGETPLELPRIGCRSYVRAVDLNHDPHSQLRYAGDKARWYADAIAAGIEPARPAAVDRRVHIPRFDFDRYVVLAPFSAWARRDWSAAHWMRLTHLLREAGYEVVAIGTKRDAKRFDEVFTPTSALWAIDHAAEWVMDAMLGAACVLGNDSGMSHLAGLLRVPAIAVHAHLPPDFLFAHARIRSVVPKTSCVFCRWQSDRGHNTACDAACSALGTVGPEEVLRAVTQITKEGRRLPGRERIRRAVRRLSETRYSEAAEIPLIEPTLSPATPVPISEVIQSALPSGLIDRIEPAVLKAAASIGWQSILPFLTDAHIAEYEASATAEEREQLDEWLDVERVINPRPARHVVAGSLFWKNVDVNDPELPTPTLDLLQNARKHGLVRRFEPWKHYIEPLLEGAARIAQRQHDVTVRVYLARDLEFLVPMLTQHCEVRLMRHASVRAQPGMMWRFLAFEEAADIVSIIDADALGHGAENIMQLSESLEARGVGTWRQTNGKEVDASGVFIYRPIVGCGFGSRLRLPMARLMKAFIWHYQRGFFPTTMMHPHAGEVPHFRHPWPGYGIDESFLTAAIYPRVLPYGLLSNPAGPQASSTMHRDLALTAMTNPRSGSW